MPYGLPLACTFPRVLSLTYTSFWFRLIYVLPLVFTLYVFFLVCTDANYTVGSLPWFMCSVQLILTFISTVYHKCTPKSDLLLYRLSPVYILSWFVSCVHLILTFFMTCYTQCTPSLWFIHIYILLTKLILVLSLVHTFSEIYLQHTPILPGLPAVYTFPLVYLFALFISVLSPVFTVSLVYMWRTPSFWLISSVNLFPNDLFFYVKLFLISFVPLKSSVYTFAMAYLQCTPLLGLV